MKPLSGRLGRCLGASSSRGSRCSVPVGTVLGSQEPEQKRVTEESRLSWISHTAMGDRTGQWAGASCVFPGETGWHWEEMGEVPLRFIGARAPRSCWLTTQRAPYMLSLVLTALGSRDQPQPVLEMKKLMH